MQLMGICPSATSIWSLCPSRFPCSPCCFFAARVAKQRRTLQHLFHRHRILFARTACCSSRVGSGSGRGSFFFGLPRLRCFFSSADATGTAGGRGGFSRASISVASRDMWPISRSFCVASISVACKRWANSVLTNSAKAHANTVSSSISPHPSQPHMRRKETSTESRSSKCRVVLMLN
jgi:hypothetical protein